MKQSSLLFSDSQRGPRGLVVLLGFAVVLLALASCAVSAAEQPAAQLTAASVAAPAIASTSAAPAAEVGASTLPLGSFANPLAHGGPGILTLSAGGQYTQGVGEASSALIKGTWKMAGDQIEFTETGAGGCAGEQGTYKWALDGKALSFKLVQDTCSPRAGDFTSGPWTRQP